MSSIFVVYLKMKRWKMRVADRHWIVWQRLRFDIISPFHWLRTDVSLLTFLMLFDFMFSCIRQYVSRKYFLLCVFPFCTSGSKLICTCYLSADTNCHPGLIQYCFSLFFSDKNLFYSHKLEIPTIIQINWNAGQLIFSFKDNRCRQAFVYFSFSFCTS